MSATNRNAPFPPAPVGKALAHGGGPDEGSPGALDVTEYDGIMAALFLSGTLNRTFLEQSPIGIAHLDMRGVVTFENHHLRTITGEDAEAAWIGHPLPDVAGLDERLPRLVERMLAEGTSFEADDLVIARTDGERRVIRAYGAAIRHPEDGIVGGVLMLLDITAEHERREEIRVLRRYDEAGLALRDAALSATSSVAFLAATARILGETALADCVVILLPDEGADGYGERARWSSHADGAVPSLHLPAEDWHALTQSGTDPSDLAAVQALGCGGDVAALPFATEAKRSGSILVCTSDRNAPPSAAERRALRRLGVLFETLWGWMFAESRYRQVVASLEDSLFSFSLTERGERCYSFATEQIERLTGYEVVELLEGGLSWEADVVYDEDREAVARHNEVLASGRESRLIYRIRTAGGGIRWLRESATPTRDGAARVVVAGILSDVTEAKEAEATLIQAKQDAESATRMKSTFLATMSHEIRTPLGAISGFADLLVEEVGEMEDASPVITEFAETIQTSSKKVLRLVNDLFDLASLQSGRIYVDRAPVALHPILADVCTRHRVALADRGVDLMPDLAAGDPIVLGEARRIEQIAEHLVSNAAKFTEDGHVRVGTRVETDAVRIVVADTGIGIEPDYLPALFEPFSQEDNRLNRNYAGSGLGLAIVKRLIEAMNGTISVASTKGEGTRFEVTLPRADG